MLQQWKHSPRSTSKDSLTGSPKYTRTSTWPQVVSTFTYLCPWPPTTCHLMLKSAAVLEKQFYFREAYVCDNVSAVVQILLSAYCCMAAWTPYSHPKQMPNTVYLHCLQSDWTSPGKTGLPTQQSWREFKCPPCSLFWGNVVSTGWAISSGLTMNPKGHPNHRPINCQKANCYEHVGKQDLRLFQIGQATSEDATQGRLQWQLALQIGLQK